MQVVCQWLTEVMHWCLCRSQDLRKERKAIREGKLAAEEAVIKPPEQEEPFSIEEYKDTSGKGSFDTGDPLTTNLYVGNINPKVSARGAFM